MTSVVREEAEAAVVEAAEEDDAGRRPGVGRGGGERHRLGFVHTRRDGGVVPGRELADRIPIDGRLVEAAAFVFLPGVRVPRFHPISFDECIVARGIGLSAPFRQGLSRGRSVCSPLAWSIALRFVWRPRIIHAKVYLYHRWCSPPL
jgi:hypothetical protein